MKKTQTGERDVNRMRDVNRTTVTLELTEAQAAMITMALVRATWDDVPDSRAALNAFKDAVYNEGEWKKVFESMGV